MQWSSSTTRAVLVATAARIEFRRDELITCHFENKTCCQKQNLRNCSEELVEVVEIDRLEIAALNLLHQAFKLSEKGTTCEQRKQQSNK